MYRMKNHILIPSLLMFFLTGCMSREKSSELKSIDNNMPCPEGYLLISANSSVGVPSDFCVMKYEARNVNGVPLSQPDGSPWHNITAVDALTACQAVGQKFDLISNAEWMTIARNLESVDSNWENGKINRGWSAWRVEDGFQNTTTAPSSLPSCLFNQSKDTCASTGQHSFRRTHKLSNGEEIWDFSGNVYEWVDWIIESNNIANYTLAPTGCPQGWKEIPAMIASCHGQTPDLGNPANGASHLVSPSNTNLTSKQFIGQINGGSGGAAMRGGHWKSGAFGGIYSLILHDPANLAVSGVGFRCVYRL